ncbi:MAG: DNA repair protein RecN [Bacteroidales bacterium]
MLKNLFIQNYALIDHLDIDFHKGLNTITGETGAGKSIILGALGLILGNRADIGVLKDKQKNCVVEGTFDISAYSLNNFFVENDLDYQSETLIRRQINPAGKSRAFVNELPVTLAVLKDLVSRIIDIHSQHQNLLLADSSFQLTVLDAYTNNIENVLGYRRAYRKFTEVDANLKELKEKAEKSQADFDYLNFQLNELEEAKLKPEEDDELEKLEQQLSHAEEIKSTLQGVSSYLNADDTSILVWLKQVETMLGRINNVYPESEELARRVESCRIELQDLAREVDLQNDKVELDPSQLEAVTQRLNTILTLQQKHRVNSVDELIGVRDNLKAEVDDISSYDISIEKMTKEVAELETQALGLAKEISSIRKKGTPDFEKSIIAMLTQLGMQHAGFKVHFQPLNELTPSGLDKITFQFSANKQMSLQDLSKVASGGELSRLMLSLKSIMVQTKGLPTIILDEIDTGVSGDVADKVGNIINDMAKGMQVINITHLPQIASKGKHHLLVYKNQDGDTTRTQIKRLTDDERVQEIAKMLSGEKVSEAALTNARDLLKASSS